ncbi:hypothetical protein BRC81_06960 [Halobacteriales archaeon QS_1_68_20]|nr:MAG: hypothetical protein BRC81_06960 [Halobacteriales archaeon QS_1_68_20]
MESSDGGLPVHEPGEDVLPGIDASDRGDVSALDFVDEELNGDGDTYKISFYKVFELIVTVEDELLEIELQAAGVRAAHAKFTPDDTSASMSGHAVVAKYDLELSANFNELTLHPSGKGCYWDFKWECATFDRTILHF